MIKKEDILKSQEMWARGIIKIGESNDNYSRAKNLTLEFFAINMLFFTSSLLSLLLKLQFRESKGFFEQPPFLVKKPYFKYGVLRDLIIKCLFFI